EARRLLAPGGKVIVAVPNIDSLQFRWFGAAWYGLDLPRHLTHFTPDTLKAMLQRAGFGVRRMRMVRHSDWLRSSAPRPCGRPPARPLPARPPPPAAGPPGELVQLRPPPGRLPARHRRRGMTRGAPP